MTWLMLQLLGFGASQKKNTIFLINTWRSKEIILSQKEKILFKKKINQNLNLKIHYECTPTQREKEYS